jgi:hypothetical protein
MVDGFTESVQVGALVEEVVVDVCAHAIPTMAESMISIVAPTIANEMAHGELKECEVFIKNYIKIITILRKSTRARVNLL